MKSILTPHSNLNRICIMHTTEPYLFAPVIKPNKPLINEEYMPNYIENVGLPFEPVAISSPFVVPKSTTILFKHDLAYS